jgi:hypothetical protein
LLEGAGFGPIDYFELRDAETLEPMTTLSRPARILAAARLGKTRLIDNLAVVAIQIHSLEYGHQRVNHLFGDCAPDMS